MTTTQIVIGLVVLLVLGLAWRAGARRAKAARTRVHLVSLAGRVVVNAAFIVTAQWAVITYGHARWLLLAALAGPALLASYTLTKALTVTTLDRTPGRGERR